MKKTFLTIFSFLTLLSVSSAQKEGLDKIGQNDLKAYMEFFASDNMAGRETGTLENEISAMFIKANLMRLNLKPVPGTSEYFQKLPLFSTNIDRKESGIKIMNAKGEIVVTSDSLVAIMPPSKTMEVTGNVVFAGYGYENKNSGYNDFENLDIKGRIVMIMTRNPEAVKAGDGMSVFSEKLESAKFSSLIIRNPSAILFVYDPENSFSDAYESGLADMVGVQARYH